MASVFVLAGMGVVAVLGLFFGLAVLSSARERYRQRQALAERTPMSALEPGAATVTGRTRAAGDRRAEPFFADADPGTGPLAMRYLVETYRPRAKRESWRTESVGVAGVPFVVEDDDGAVLVDPGGLSESGIDVADDATVTRTVDDGAASPVSSAYAAEDADEARRRRYTAERIDPGTAVTVAGEATRTDGVPEGFGPGETPAYTLSDGSTGLLVGDRPPAVLREARDTGNVVGTVLVGLLFGLAGLGAALGLVTSLLA
jgi:hypothetical protein